MKCIDKKELKTYVEARLDPERMIEIDEHISSCSNCRAALGDIAPLKKAAAELGASLLGMDDCPEYEDISAFVDGALPSDRMVSIQSHIHLCEACFADVEQIREMRSHAALREKITVHPMATRRAASHGFGIWKRVFAGFAGAAVIAGAAIVIGSFTSAPKLPTMVAAKPPVVDQIKPNVSNLQPKPGKSAAGVKPNVGTPAAEPDKVSAKPEPKSRVILKDGNYSVIKRNGRMVFADASGAPRTALEAKIAASIEEKLRTGKVTHAKTAQYAMAEVHLRDNGAGYTPSPNAPKPAAPIGKVVMADRPTLTWSKVNLADSYRVRVYDSQFQLVSEITTDKNSITLPKSLARGAGYIWRVGVRFSESDSWAESKPVKFFVLSSDGCSSIQKVKRTLPGSHIALGAAYESVGLYDEARQEYRELRRSNRNSPLAKDLLYKTGNIK
ncbi:MAG: zf-HC2 domain-containing protein [Armatimonadota bacterium]